jgi:hypothetical protein
VKFEWKQENKQLMFEQWVFNHHNYIQDDISMSLCIDSSYHTDNLKHKHNHNFLSILQTYLIFHHHKCIQNDISMLLCIDKSDHIDNLNHNHNFRSIRAIHLICDHHKCILGCISMSLCIDKSDHKYSLPNNCMKLLQHGDICIQTFFEMKWLWIESVERVEKVEKVDSLVMEIEGFLQKWEKWFEGKVRGWLVAVWNEYCENDDHVSLQLVWMDSFISGQLSRVFRSENWQADWSRFEFNIVRKTFM